jgi:hypothetical protein
VFPKFPAWLIAAVLLALAGPVMAQGSIFPQGSGMAKPPDGGDPRARRPDKPDYREYDYGKETYAVKLACDTCPLAGQQLDEKLARRFMEDETLWETLSPKEYSAVTTYLRQLFTL